MVPMALAGHGPGRGLAAPPAKGAGALRAEAGQTPLPRQVGRPRRSGLIPRGGTISRKTRHPRRSGAEVLGLCAPVSARKPCPPASNLRFAALLDQTGPVLIPISVTSKDCDSRQMRVCSQMPLFGRMRATFALRARRRQGRVGDASRYSPGVGGAITGLAHGGVQVRRPVQFALLLWGRADRGWGDPWGPGPWLIMSRLRRGFELWGCRLASVREPWGALRQECRWPQAEMRAAAGGLFHR